ncbi:hypothetical protein [Paracoccus denitrificans]|uniref:hypothetical protein n=1 Tax=Paracoccus denitrificans TaxID=266 RepID=UPI000CECB473|nr:hypothetical protein [Paracoccus denitrificans]
MAQTRLHINTGIDLSGRGLPPIVPPFPSFDGDLFGAYCFGTKYAPLGTDPLAERYGLRFDWSGQGRHLTTAGVVPVHDWHFTSGATTVTPLTPFNLSDVAAENGEASVIMFARTTPTARPVTLARSLNVAPYLQLSLLPQAVGGTVSAIMNDGASNSAQVTGIGDDLERICLYGGSFRLTDRTAWQAGPDTPLRSAVNETDVAVASSGVFHFGIEASTGDTAATQIYAGAIYKSYLSADQVVQVQECFRAWHEAAESGLVI